MAVSKMLRDSTRLGELAVAIRKNCKTDGAAAPATGPGGSSARPSRVSAPTGRQILCNFGLKDARRRALGAANFCKNGLTVGNKGGRVTTVNSRRIFYSFPTTTGVRIKG